jgi:fatty-acyl-CoA synthase
MELVHKTLGECLRETALKYPDHIGMERDGWTCTFKEMDEITDAYAGRLMHQYGIRKGMHVGIWSVNTPSFVFTTLALAKIGAVTCVFNTFYKVEEMSKILRTSDVELLFYGSGCKDTVYDDLIPEIKRRTPSVRHFYHIDEKEGGIWMSMDSFSEKEKTEEALQDVHEVAQKVTSEDPIFIIFTSGTTDIPKGVVLTHFGVVNDVLHVKYYMHWSENDKMCVCVPMFHCFGLVTALVGSIAIGFTMHLLPYFRTATVWRAILDFHCTILIGVPSMFLALIHKSEYAGLLGTSLTSGIVGGSPLPAEQYIEICRRFPNMHLQTSFGMTEMSASVTNADWDEPIEKKAVTCGRLMEDVEGRIAETTTGKVLGKNQIGEIQFRGFNVMKEYYNNPEKTKEAFTKDGWFRTGDLGYFNNDDELCVTGRLKDIIIRGGENISPVEIEDVILRSGMVDEVKVIGVPSKFRQEEVAACIVPKNHNDLNIEHFCAFLRPRLATYKLPYYIISFDKLPMTASGKPDIKEIRDQAIAMIKNANNRCYINK